MRAQARRRAGECFDYHTYADRLNGFFAAVTHAGSQTVSASNAT
jgi:hypothetical protein